MENKENLTISISKNENITNIIRTFIDLSKNKYLLDENILSENNNYILKFKKIENFKDKNQKTLEKNYNFINEINIPLSSENNYFSNLFLKIRKSLYSSNKFNIKIVATKSYFLRDITKTKNIILNGTPISLNLTYETSKYPDKIDPIKISKFFEINKKELQFLKYLGKLLYNNRAINGGILSDLTKINILKFHSITKKFDIQIFKNCSENSIHKLRKIIDNFMSSNLQELEIKKYNISILKILPLKRFILFKIFDNEFGFLLHINENKCNGPVHFIASFLENNKLFDTINIELTKKIISYMWSK